MRASGPPSATFVISVFCWSLVVRSVKLTDCEVCPSEKDFHHAVPFSAFSINHSL